MQKLSYPPTVEPDGSLVYEGWKYPRETGWHERDRDNPMRLEFIGEDCGQRRMELRPQCCGNAAVRMICECEACPIYGLTLVPTDCELCKHREAGAGKVVVKLE